MDPIVAAGGAKGKEKKGSRNGSKPPSAGAELPVSPPFTVQVPAKLPTPEKEKVPSRVIFDDGTMLEDCGAMSISSDDSDVTAGASAHTSGSLSTPTSGGGLP
eukprot:3609615-Rhodomonas_salina.1